MSRVFTVALDDAGLSALKALTEQHNAVIKGTHPDAPDLNLEQLLNAIMDRLLLHECKASGITVPELESKYRY